MKLLYKVYRLGKGVKYTLIFIEELCFMDTPI